MSQLVLLVTPYSRARVCCLLPNAWSMSSAVDVRMGSDVRRYEYIR